MNMAFGNRFGTKFSTKVTGLGAPTSGYFGATPLSDPSRLRDKIKQKPRRVGLGVGGPNPFANFMPVSMRQTSQPAAARPAPWARSSVFNRGIRGNIQPRGMSSRFIRG